MKVEGDNPWPVMPDDIRPVGSPDACCYCKVRLGQQHKPGCVIRERTVVVDVTIRLVRRVPEAFSSHEIEYGMNRARWCATNILGELDRLAAHAEHTASGCLCEFFTGHYVREATAEDEETFGVRAERKPRRQLDTNQD